MGRVFLRENARGLWTVVFSVVVQGTRALIWVIAVVYVGIITVQVPRYTMVTDRDIICSIPTTSDTLYGKRYLRVAGKI